MHTRSLETDINALIAAGDMAGATTMTLAHYGPDIAGFLLGMFRERAAAQDAYSQFCEDVWHGLATYRGDASLRAWLYAVARNGALRTMRKAKPQRLASPPELLEIVAKERTQTFEYLKTDVKERFSELRSELDPDDQILLILRVDRDLSWEEVVQVLEGDSAGRLLSKSEAAKRAVKWRKRFERVRDQIRHLAEKKGLIPRRAHKPK